MKKVRFYNNIKTHVHHSDFHHPLQLDVWRMLCVIVVAKYVIVGLGNTGQDECQAT